MQTKRANTGDARDWPPDPLNSFRHVSALSGGQRKHVSGDSGDEDSCVFRADKLTVRVLERVHCLHKSLVLVSAYHRRWRRSPPPLAARDQSAVKVLKCQCIVHFHVNDWLLVVVVDPHSRNKSRRWHSHAAIGHTTTSSYTKRTDPYS